MKKNRALWIILIVLILALAGVLGVILFKQAEYKASEAFYEGLRTGARAGGWIA